VSAGGRRQSLEGPLERLEVLLDARLGDPADLLGEADNRAPAIELVLCARPGPWGWLGSLLGVTAGPIDSFIPVFLFAILFGLSMDYEVFLVSRIHEEWTRRRNASQAVVNGVSTSGRVITAAAAIMVCVFLSFVAGDDRVLKLFGISLAAGVFIDALVVRSLLLPAVLHLLGRRTWALPAWLDRRLPHLAIDAEPVEEAG
jgi:RND superfamily putative drug exporter